MANVYQTTEHSKERQDDNIVVSVERVSKKFCRGLKRSLFYGAQDIASEMVGTRKGSEKLRKGEFWALKDVSCSLRQGDALGLVGPNGSGKTTLLRIISGLIKLDSGSVKVKGRVAPLVALGAGFNPILTGRENIYVNMTILGLSKKEIDARFDAVVDFAEIEEAIDAPVQTYSSGMAARLGFSCAIHTHPDILLVDEVLTVGDIKFRAKCQRRLSEIRKKGTSFILVSHRPQAVIAICESAVYLSKGHVIMSGSARSVISRYEQDLFMGGTEELGILRIPDKPKNESLGLNIISVCFRNANGQQIDLPVSGEPVFLCVGCRVLEKWDDLDFRFVITAQAREGEQMLFMSSRTDEALFSLPIGAHEVQVEMPYLCLRSGLYSMRIVVRSGRLYTLDVIESFRFQVSDNRKTSQCVFYQPRTWKIVDGVN